MESNDLMQNIENSMKPYRGKFTTYSRLPAEGRDRDEILEEMRAFYQLEESKWKDGYVSGTVYHGDQEHIDFLNEVSAINSQSNPMHFDTWPSTIKFEAEIVIRLLKTGSNVCGNRELRLDNCLGWFLLPQDVKKVLDLLEGLPSQKIIDLILEMERDFSII